ncbi:MAG: hypothetical protein HY744_06025 [Deltaproteobacteria bacterium]|nr:hypothetical protein [Deltaproteobacteria bacterium]
MSEPEEEFEEVGAWAFKSDLSLAQMLAALGAQGRWQWSERDSDYWGDYLSAWAYDDCARVRIFEEDDFFVVDLLFESSAADAAEKWQAFQDEIMTGVLPALGARDVAETESYG